MNAMHTLLLIVRNRIRRMCRQSAQAKRERDTERALASFPIITFEG